MIYSTCRKCHASRTLENVVDSRGNTLRAIPIRRTYWPMSWSASPSCSNGSSVLELQASTYYVTSACCCLVVPCWRLQTFIL